MYLVLGGCTWSQGGVPGPGDVPGPGGCTWSWGVYLVGGGVPGWGVSAPGAVSAPGPGGVSGTPPLLTE